MVICKIIYICVNGNKECETVHKSSLKQKAQTVPHSEWTEHRMWISNKTTCNNTDTSAFAKNTKGKKEKDNKYSP